jgi:hypothetical protein
MSDEELVGYAAIHCKTDRALFSRDHVERLLKLADKPMPPGLPDFVAVHEETMMPIVEEARRRMYSPGPYSGTGR